jgi:MFS family permease
LKRDALTVLPIVAMNHAVNDGSVYLLSSLFPVVLAIFGLTVFQVGVLVGVGYLVSVIGQPIVGRYSESQDPRKLLAIGIAVISLSVLSFVLSTGFYSLLASVVLLRVGSSFYHPVGVSAVSRTYAGPALERAMGTQSAFGNLGIFLVFVTAAPIYLAFGWKATFVLFTVVCLMDVAITLALYRGPSSSGAPPKDETVDGVQDENRLGIPLFFLVSAFVSGASFAVILNYANILLQSEAHVGVFEANIAVSGWIALAFVGAITTGRWPWLMRRPVLLSLVYLVSGVSTMLLALASTDILLTLPLLLVNGFMLSASYPLTYSELSEYLDPRPHLKGRSFGTVFSAQTVGASALGLVSGYLSTLYGIPSAFYVAGVLMLVGSGMALVWARRARVTKD